MVSWLVIQAGNIPMRMMKCDPILYKNTKYQHQVWYIYVDRISKMKFYMYTVTQWL
jgi:hypothetical protein